jgi:hypothetical protein
MKIYVGYAIEKYIVFHAEDANFTATAKNTG